MCFELPSEKIHNRTITEGLWRQGDVHHYKLSLLSSFLMIHVTTSHYGVTTMLEMDDALPKKATVFFDRNEKG